MTNKYRERVVRKHWTNFSSCDAGLTRCQSGPQPTNIIFIPHLTQDDVDITLLNV